MPLYKYDSFNRRGNKVKGTIEATTLSVAKQMLRGQGLNVVELTYRTPVREAMYEISTCRQVICYDGMWHYIAKNFARPMAVVSNEGVTKYHTPHAIRMNPLGEVKYDVWWWMSHMTQLLGHSRKKAMDWESVLGEVYKI